MTPGQALPCPHCKRELAPESWIDPTAGVCVHCRTRFDFTGFPALTAVATKLTPQAAVLAADSVCFFHPENRAEAVCDSCGRLLCPVCSIPFGGQRICPTCIAANRKSGVASTVRHRVIYDNIALALAVYPVLLVVTFMLTIVTAPAALVMVIVAWNKPRSLVRGPGRLRLIVAGILALLQIGAWATYFVSLSLKR